MPQHANRRAAARALHVLSIVLLVATIAVVAALGGGVPYVNRHLLIAVAAGLALWIATIVTWRAATHYATRPRIPVLSDTEATEIDATASNVNGPPGYGHEPPTDLVVPPRVPLPYRRAGTSAGYDGYDC